MWGSQQWFTAPLLWVTLGVGGFPPTGPLPPVDGWSVLRSAASTDPPPGAVPDPADGVPGPARVVADPARVGSGRAGVGSGPTGGGSGPAGVGSGPTWVVPVAVPSPARPGGFRWPLDGPPRPVRRFDPPPQPWLPGHRGVDLAASPGDVVRAAGPGTVLFAGTVAGRPVVSVRHADGSRTTYEPVPPSVRVGDRVVAGAPLGRLAAGHPGCPAPACLHWGLRREDSYLDPLSLLGLGRVRLLPRSG